MFTCGNVVVIALHYSDGQFESHVKTKYTFTISIGVKRIIKSTVLLIKSTRVIITDHLCESTGFGSFCMMPYLAKTKHHTSKQTQTIQSRAAQVPQWSSQNPDFSSMEML